MPVTTDLKPTKQVSIYVSRSKEQQLSLAKRFAPLINNGGWKIVGTVTAFGPTYYTEDIKALAMSKGADTVLIHIGKTNQVASLSCVGKLRALVSYGYGYPSGPNYYYVNPFIAPYQVAPPQGGLLESMTAYADARRRWAQQDRIRAIQDAEWTQDILFLRSPNNS